MIKPADMKMAALFDRWTCHKRIDLTEPGVSGGRCRERGFVLHDPSGCPGRQESQYLTMAIQRPEMIHPKMFWRLPAVRGHAGYGVLLRFGVKVVESELGENSWLTVDADPP